MKLVKFKSNEPLVIRVTYTHLVLSWNVGVHVCVHVGAVLYPLSVRSGDQLGFSGTASDMGKITLILVCLTYDSFHTRVLDV